MTPLQWWRFLLAVLLLLSTVPASYTLLAYGAFLEGERGMPWACAGIGVFIACPVAAAALLFFDRAKRRTRATNRKSGDA